MSEARHNPVLSGQTAVITGGASGIGKSIVQRFLEAGASCLAADLNEEALAALKQELAEYGDKLDVVKVDVSNRDDVEGMVDRAVQTFGQMDIIVNNAGIMDNLLPIAEMDDDVWERLMKVNLNSVMYGTRKAVRYFMERGEGGVIINTASLSGLCAGRGGCAYTASKFAVVGLTKNVGPAGVTIVIVRDDLVSESLPGTPTMLRYDTHVDAKSLYNTPPAYGIYMCGKVFQWLKAQGGLEAMKERNVEKAQLLYDFLDQSALFKGTARKEDRSIMNVPFVTGSDELDAKFVAEAKKVGIESIKGHRSVGGMRASIYNAMPRAGVEALVKFMGEFERENA